MEYIQLQKKDFFKVLSKVTDRKLTVVGLYIENDEIVKYEIRGEGDWYINRFIKVKNDKLITQEEFNELKQRVKQLEEQINKKTIAIHVHNIEI